MKKLLTAATVVVALVVAPAAGVAGAADSTSPSATASGHGHGRRAARVGGVAADAIGISRRSLAEALRGGKSVAEVAKDHGVDPEKVVDAVVAAATKRVDEAVANGKLDADRAASIKDGLRERVTKLVNATKDQRVKARMHRASVRRHARRGALEVVAHTIGVDARTVVEARRDGKSVADLAREHGVDPQTVVDAVVDAGTKKIDGAVANGKLDADRAATIKDRLPERVTRLVNATGGARGAAAA